MKNILWLISLVLLSGCGGGGGGGSSSTPPPSANVSAAGIWTGTAYSNITKQNTTITGIVAENNRAHFLSVSQSAVSPNLAPSDASSSGRYPVSGTPHLKPQRQFLLRDYGPPTMAKAEKTVFADTVEDQKPFYAHNFGTGSDYQTQATCKGVTLLPSGNFLYIYVENTELTRAPSLFTPGLFNAISSEYVNKILPKEATYFGSPRARDFTILLLDIQDGGGSTYISGYFDALNLIPGATKSNNRDMIYMDSRQGTPGSQSFYGTFAHEFNHYIHYLNDQNEATWVEEGMAGLARFVCGYGPQASHVNAFGTTPNTSLTVWGGGLANYGATFLFMLYMEEHYGGASLTKAIMSNGGIGIEGINNALGSIGYAEKVDDIFKNWIMANYLNNSSLAGGIYGYQTNFAAYSALTYAPGNILVGRTATTYPWSGIGTVQPYAADYVKFTSLPGTYNIFTLAVYSLASSGSQSYSYSASLGSLILTLSGLNSTLGAEGVKQGMYNPPPAVVTNLAASNAISTTDGGTTAGTSAVAQYAGTISMSGATLLGEATAYAPYGYIFLNGSQVGPMAFSATVNQRVSMNGIYSGVGDNGTISLTYDARYERPSSLAAIQGAWRMSDAALGVVQYVISSTGTLTGTAGTGCLITGSVSLINPAYNAYQLNVTLSNCGVGNGTYSGLATLADTAVQNDSMISGVSNATGSIVGRFTRQAY